MCLECGCGEPGNVNIHGSAKRDSALSPLIKSPTAPPSAAEIEHFHGEEPHHPGHAHTHGQDGPVAHLTYSIPVHEAVLAKNDRQAERNRGFFKAKGIFVLNMVSSPGSGKTSLIQQTAIQLTGKLRTGVIVGDLATENDAERLRRAAIPVVQINTGTVCHLDAEMVARAMAQLDLNALDLLVIENVGNLVCPAVFDLGEHLRVVLLSTTEGEDKPLKYPPIFHSAQVALVTKTDLGAVAGFDRQAALRHLHRISHHASVFEVSARTGEGMGAWCQYLMEQCKASRENP